MKKLIDYIYKKIFLIISFPINIRRAVQARKILSQKYAEFNHYISSRKINKIILS